MSIQRSPVARPEFHEPLVVATAEGDDTGWLVTFSDLVLQLFAFVIVVAVCGTATHHVERRAPGATTSATALVDASLPTAERESVAAATADGDTPPQRLATEDELIDAEPAPERVDALTAFAPATAWAGDAATLGSGRVREDAARADVDAAQADVDAASRAEAGAGFVAAPGAGVRDRAGAARAASTGRVRALGRYLEAFVASARASNDATVTPGDGDLRLAFGGRLGFRPGSAELPPAGRGLLREVRRLASGIPDLEVEVAGYTDDVPIHTREFPSNLELSLARAARVARELQRDDPELAVRTVALGFGPHHALAPNDGPANRARNRRVEVRLIAGAQSMP